MKKILGFVLLGLSFAAWGAIGLLAFIDISKSEVAGVTTVLIIVGELLFVASIAMLGKEVWSQIKASFKRNKSNT